MFRRQLLWQGFGATWWLLFWSLAIVASIVLIVMLMRYERRLVPKRVGNTLLVLRLMVLGLLFLTLLQPVLAWTLDREHAGRIVVAVDLSESMVALERLIFHGPDLTLSLPHAEQNIIPRSIQHHKIKI